MIVGAVALITGIVIGRQMIERPNDTGLEDEDASATTEASSLAPQLSVEPEDGLGDGDSLSITGAGFRPGSDVGVAMCAGRGDELEALSGEESLEHCDLSTVVNAKPDEAGEFEVVMSVRRVLFTPASEEVDCAQAQAACLVAAASVSDLDESAWQPLDFADAPALPRPVLDVVERTQRETGEGSTLDVHVVGHGFVPGSEVLLAGCYQEDDHIRRDLCFYDTGAAVVADAAGTIEANVTVAQVQVDDQVVDCANGEAGCVITTSRPRAGNLVATVEVWPTSGS